MEDSETLYLGVDFSTQQVYFYDSQFCFTFPVTYVMCNIYLTIFECVYKCILEVIKSLPKLLYPYGLAFNIQGFLNIYY